MLFLPLRYLTLVPATLIIYAGTLFNVINVSACSTNTDNFLSLRTPQHLHRKAEDSYEIPLLAEVVAGLFHLPMYSGDSEWTGTTAAARWWVRNSGLFHSLLLTPGFTFSAGQGENSKVGPRKIVLTFFMQNWSLWSFCPLPLGFQRLKIFWSWSWIAEIRLPQIGLCLSSFAAAVELVDRIDGLLVIGLPRLVCDVSHGSISISISISIS